MKSKKNTASILTTGEILRIHAAIAADIKIREEASERISENQERLRKHNAAVEGQSTVTVAKAMRKVRKLREKPVLKHREKPTIAKTILELPLEPAPATTVATPTPTKHERGGGSYSVVMEILRRAPREGLPAPELRRQAAAHPDASDSLKNHPSYIYSILEQLKGRTEVERTKDGKWKAAEVSAATH